MAGHRPFFTLVAALGNPGENYEGTRHNAGFVVADRIADTTEGISGSFKVSGGIARTFILAGEKVCILKPLKYMNMSGEIVAAFAKKNEIAPGEIVVVHDDMDIPLGKIRIGKGGGSAGHKGVQSVIDCLGTSDFVRLRVGIGRKKEGETIDHVLSAFSEKEEQIFGKTVELSVSAVKFLLENGVETAMNKYNGCHMAADLPDGHPDKKQNKDKMEV